MTDKKNEDLGKIALEEMRRICGVSVDGSAEFTTEISSEVPTEVTEGDRKAFLAQSLFVFLSGKEDRPIFVKKLMSVIMGEDEFLVGYDSLKISELIKEWISTLDPEFIIDAERILTAYSTKCSRLGMIDGERGADFDSKGFEELIEEVNNLFGIYNKFKYANSEALTFMGDFYCGDFEYIDKAIDRLSQLCIPLVPGLTELMIFLIKKQMEIAQYLVRKFTISKVPIREGEEYGDKLHMRVCTTLDCPDCSRILGEKAPCFDKSDLEAIFHLADCELFCSQCSQSLTDLCQKYNFNK